MKRNLIAAATAVIKADDQLRLLDPMKSTNADETAGYDAVADAIDSLRDALAIIEEMTTHTCPICGIVHLPPTKDSATP